MSALRNREDSLRMDSAENAEQLPATFFRILPTSSSVQGNSSRSGKRGHLEKMSSASSGNGVLTVSQLPFLLFMEPELYHQLLRCGALAKACELDLEEEERLRDL